MSWAPEGEEQFARLMQKEKDQAKGLALVKSQRSESSFPGPSFSL